VDTVLLVLRLLLAGVFAVAGVAKLADLRGSRRAIVDFGLPAALAAPLGLLLPLAELLIAAALLPARTAWWGAVGALVLLLLFMVGIAANMARGRAPDCHCFGQLHSRPVGWSTLARNAALALLAAFVVSQGQDRVEASAVSWLAGLSAPAYAGLFAGLVLLALAAVQGWFLLHLLQQNGRLLVRVEALEARLGINGPAGAEAETARRGLPVGAPAPAFRLPALSGKMVTLDSLRGEGKPVLLLFSSPDCAPCNTLLPEIGRWQRDHADRLTVACISRGSLEVNRAKSEGHGLTNLLLQMEREVAEAYEARVTPSAVLINPDGTIGTPLAVGPDAIRTLVEGAVIPPDSLRLLLAGRNGGNGNGNGNGNGHAKERAPALGEAAPTVMLPDLSGNTIDLATLRGKETLVLFWNPGCVFCQRMLADLKLWEAKPAPESPQLLIVSKGTIEANRALGLRSTIVLDQNFAVGRAFGAGGTPSAVLVDAQGRIASGVVVGAPAVLELAKTGRVNVKAATVR
jgi:peroxiredoxin/uncharacterized membrane protein YphA (DoxX/SURF4 family)